MEMVCSDVAAQCALLEKLHGLQFGEPLADLGMARLAAHEAAGATQQGDTGTWAIDILNNLQHGLHQT